jgi:hypothetical protein
MTVTFYDIGCKIANRQRMYSPSLHYSKPNPRAEFALVFVNGSLKRSFWQVLAAQTASF